MLVDTIKKHWLAILIFMQPFLDMIAYFQYDNVIGSLAGYLRLFIMAGLTVLAFVKTKKKKSYALLLGIMALFSMLHIANCFRVGYIDPFADIAYLLRVLHMPVLTLALIYLPKDHDEIPKAYYINAVVILVSIVLATLTQTGEWTYRLYDTGLTGWFANANGQSIILVTLVAMFTALGPNIKRLWGQLLLFVPGWLLLISNGTKVCFYGIFIIYGGYFCFLIFAHFLKKTKLNAAFLILCVCAILVTALVYPQSPRGQMDEIAWHDRNVEQGAMNEDLGNMFSDISQDEILANPEYRKQLIAYYVPYLDAGLVEKFGVERVLKEYGYFPSSSLLHDVRFQKRVAAKLVFEDSDLLTRLLGFEYSNMISPLGDVTYDLENDYPAIFYYYGYVGFALYMAFIGWFIFLLFKKVCRDFKGSLTVYNFGILLMLVVQLAAAQMSGAILRRPNVSFYLAVTLYLVHEQTS